MCLACGIYAALFTANLKQPAPIRASCGGAGAAGGAVAGSAAGAGGRPVCPPRRRPLAPASARVAPAVLAAPARRVLLPRRRARAAPRAPAGRASRARHRAPALVVAAAHLVYGVHKPRHSALFRTIVLGVILSLAHWMPIVARRCRAYKWPCLSGGSRRGRRCGMTGGGGKDTRARCRAEGWVDVACTYARQEACSGTCARARTLDTSVRGHLERTKESLPT